MTKPMYCLVPVVPKQNLHGLHKMDWGRRSPWRMDLQNLLEECLPGMEIMGKAACCDFLEDNALIRKIFGFEGDLHGYLRESHTEKGTVEIELFSIVKRELKKCSKCSCYHQADEPCPPAVKVGQP